VADEFLTEDQEAERAKQWLRENGLYIVAGVLLGLGGLFGWQQYNDYSTAEAEQASVVWEQMRRAIDGKRYNEVDETLALLETDFSGTSYLDQGRLAKAALEMSRNNPDGALAELEIVATKGNDPQLRRVADLRRAQIMNSQERYDEALALLGDTEDGGLAGLYFELRGDALFGKGEFAAANDAYRDALNKDVAGVIDRSYVQMKQDESAAAQSAADRAVASTEAVAPAAE